MNAKPACRVVSVAIVACFALISTVIASAAEITTSQKRYAVGEGMVVYGTGFSPQVTITLTVVRPDHLTDVVPGVTTDTAGAFTANYTPPEIPGRYKFTATDGTNSATTATTGADAIGYNKGVYNKADTTHGGGAGEWTTGNAGSNYLENQWAFYQYQVTGIGQTVPDFNVGFNHWQPSSNAMFVDAFANFRACLDCADSSNPSGSKQGMLLDGVAFPPVQVPSPTCLDCGWIDAHTAISKINTAYTTDCLGAFDPQNTPSEDHCFHVDGSDLKNLLNAAYNVQHGTSGVDLFASGTHTVTLFYEAHLAFSHVWRNGKEALLACIGSDSSNYVHTFPEFQPAGTVYGTDAYNPNNANLNGSNGVTGGNGCTVTGAVWDDDQFFGIGAATGSSRNFRIANQSEGSQGGLTLPIPSVPTAGGSITISKVTVPNPAPGVVFGFTGDLGAFSLDTDTATASILNSKTFTGLEGGLIYHVAESALAGWTLGNLSCTGTGSTFVYNSESVDISLSTTDNATVTCTFTNAGLANLRIVKNTVGGDGTFNYTGTGAGVTTSFPLTTSGGTTSISFSGIAPGSKSVTETVPDGWSLTGLTCVNTAGGTPHAFTASSNGIGVELAGGEDVTCTFTNSKNATITLVKNAVGGNGTFAFAASGAGLPGAPFNVITTGGTISTTYSHIIPGSAGGPWSFTETVPAGWVGNTTNVACSTTVAGAGGTTYGGSPSNGVVAAAGTVTSPSITNIGAGASVTCTFYNSTLPTLRIVKLIHGTQETFHFAVSGTDVFPDIPLLVPANSSNSTTQMPIHSGAHTVVEQTPPAGWTLTDVSCTIGSAVNASNPLAGWNFTAGYGDTVVCTFVNSNVLTTRTQGFWATHTTLANGVWGGNGTTPPLGANVVSGTPDAKLCGPGELSASAAAKANEVMGGFWANVARKLKKSAKRSTLDQARMLMLQQYLAAVLNFHMWGAPVPGGGLNAARTAYCGTNVGLIKSWIGILGGYNTSGDTLDFTPGASATPATSKSQANIGFWDSTYQKP